MIAVSLDEQKKYKEAKNYYDSVNMTNPAIAENLQAFQDRKKALTKIVEEQNIIDRQDSLQKIAAMPETERTAFMKKLLRQLRKQQGLKEDDVSFGNTNPGFTGNNSNAPVDLFLGEQNPFNGWTAH